MELTIKQALQQGVTAHKEGKIQEAERLYRAILQTLPTHPDANHNLGVLAVSVNRTEEALPLFKTALEANPKIEKFWFSYIDALIKEKQFDNAKKVIQLAEKHDMARENLIALRARLAPIPQTENAKTAIPSHQQLSSLLEHYKKGQFGDAEKLAISLTHEFPKHQFGWKVLGALLDQTGRKSAALNANQKAVELSPQDAEAHYNLGVTFKELDRLKEAEASYRQAIALKPDYAEAHYNLGVTLQALGRLEEAEASYRQVIATKSRFAEAHNNLGNVLKKMDKLEEAEAGYRQAIALKSDFVEAHYNLGNTLKELGRLEEAEESYRKAIALKSDYVEAHNNLGIMLKELGRLEEAEASYRQVIALKPDYAEAHNNLGVTLQALGRLEEAEAGYNQAIKQKHDYAEAHRHLASMRKFVSKNKQYSKMHELYLDKNISGEQRCHINFGLAKACEDLEDFEQAFKHYSEGNATRKKLLGYDISRDITIFKQLKNSYSRIRQNSLEPSNSSKHPIPIFIVGMPRSGTTLVEQIISSHSQVTGAGELPFATQFGDAMARGLITINSESLHNFREKYLTKLQDISSGNLIVTDKTPQNFYYIGLFAASLPEAKIIHVKRNAAAVCWANFKKYFAPKTLGYCYALDDVIKYYRLYESLMAFWEKQLPKQTYDLDYELLTVNQEDETRKLINFIGLDWEDKCLSPQDNMRSVATASNIQVREKVYQGSSQQWKKYKPFLNDKLDCLDKSL